MILGLKRKRTKGLAAKDIPGFAKWISAEVYVDDKIAEACVESLALKMVGYSEWINEAMKDVSEGDGNLLESPVKNTYVSRELRQREVEVMKETTSLMTDKTEEAEFNDSFELISRDIRKSYAAKQRESIKTAEDEIKELSKLIDGDAGLFSDEDEEDIMNEDDVDVFDKIEVAQVHKTKTVSPIKFSEMPKIEPLTLRKKKKKVVEKEREQEDENKKEMEREMEKQEEEEKVVYKKVFSDTDRVIEKEKEKEKGREEAVLKLNPLPNTFFSTTGDTSIDEPTIKVKRIRPAKVAQGATTTTTATAPSTTPSHSTRLTSMLPSAGGSIPLAKRRLKSDAGSDFFGSTGTYAAINDAATTATTPLVHTLSLSHRSPRKSQRPSRLPLRVSQPALASSPVKLPWTHPIRLKAQLRRQQQPGVNATGVFGPVPPLPDL